MLRVLRFGDVVVFWLVMRDLYVFQSWSEPPLYGLTKILLSLQNL